jgi:hypothetical protein
MTKQTPGDKLGNRTCSIKTRKTLALCQKKDTFSNTIELQKKGVISLQKNPRLMNLFIS